jgi:ubiquinone biosynthesis protein
MRLLRTFRILWIAASHGLEEFFLGHERVRLIRLLMRVLFFWRRFETPRAVRLREALEKLGPIFVKFGQVLSTRPDLIPADLAEELARLQDQVPAFAPEIALAIVHRTYGKPAAAVFAAFEATAIASASVAQVHKARLLSGETVAVKILRPNIRAVIEKDLALLDTLAGWLTLLWSDGKRLRPREVVAEFAKHLEDELDLMHEAANCAQLGRNFKDSPLLAVPAVYWDYCTPEVMVMTWMDGTPVAQVDALKRRGIDMKKLGRAGVETFFTQVFRDGFFHADMHPGNIQVQDDGRYVALDFGIMGTLGEADKNYLAQNFLAFLQRDYRQVARAHIEAGWVPAGTRADEFEAAMRTICEPIFGRPLKEISFGKFLLRLFQTSRRFGMEVQPQLVLLQKTLLNIEGLGRTLDPDLDLWETGQPFLERWMQEQMGWRAFKRQIEAEAPQWAALLPQLPRLVHQHLNENRMAGVETGLKELAQATRSQNRILLALILAVLLTLAL